LTEHWCLPRRDDAAFIAALEDVLRCSAITPDPAFPLLCMDEGNKELREDARPAQPPAPGQPGRQDDEDIRHGKMHLFLACAPHLGWRHVSVTDQHTGQDWAHFIRELVDVHFPNAILIMLVMDNLSTHTAASLYRTFPPEEARRLLDKLEFHPTPKHGSWLNMAECELAALAKQCFLHRRIPDRETLEREVQAWVDARNAQQVTIDWQFTTADARIKLKRLYPMIEEINQS
jgi:hypothetical protein